MFSGSGLGTVNIVAPAPDPVVVTRPEPPPIALPDPVPPPVAIVAPVVIPDPQSGSVDTQPPTIPTYVPVVIPPVAQEYVPPDIPAPATLSGLALVASLKEPFPQTIDPATASDQNPVYPPSVTTIPTQDEIVAAHPHLFALPDTGIVSPALAIIQQKELGNAAVPVTDTTVPVIPEQFGTSAELPGETTSETNAVYIAALNPVLDAQRVATAQTPALASNNNLGIIAAALGVLSSVWYFFLL